MLLRVGEPFYRARYGEKHRMFQTSMNALRTLLRRLQGSRARLEAPKYNRHWWTVVGPFLCHAVADFLTELSSAHYLAKYVAASGDSERAGELPAMCVVHAVQ